ncbi:MAG: chemotaxis protein CheW [Sulfuricurvum sp.]|jgi:chemotaxis signal transduction protein|uniref:chemotaxis protein CheW n=1 Tax=Sulfuricurvum sp. TaxID=2025608 RepID=UPI0025F18E68|nr:chemotaxis protein CheW [Sulfuricurvum sp.]MCK9372085.1 chemotaxis protein CheW [Sulfuricurvum sp.]
MDHRLLKYMQSVERYQKGLDALSEKWNLLTMLGKMSNTEMDMNDTRCAFETLTAELLDKLGAEILKKTTSEMEAKAQVAVDIVIRNLFERTADIGFLATDDDIRAFLLNTQTLPADEVARHSLREQRQALKNRFKEYVAKYSVYSNIILTDTRGFVVAQLDERNAITGSTDPLIKEALGTSAEYVEVFRHTDLVPSAERSLVYSYRVSRSSRDESENIGVLSLIFRFEDEMEGIFKNLISEKEWMEILLLDSDGYVISSSDTNHIRLGVRMEKVLDEPYKIVRFAGREYLAKTCATKGYQGFFGLGWYGHVMVPLEHAFEKAPHPYESITADILDTVLKYSSLFSAELKIIPQKADQIQKELDVTVWNGNVQIANSKASENSFSKSLLNEISKTGYQTKKVFEDSISNLNQTVLSAYLDDARFNASLAIDIMDRNLYERANDCRWWALTSVFKEKLSSVELTGDDLRELEAILRYINNLYTVYSNLFLFDRSGTILAVSNPNEKRLVGNKVDEGWVEESLKMSDSQRYSVSHFYKTPLYDNRYTYVYSAGISDPLSEEIVGGIGIVFDSQPQFEAMLLDALPHDKEGNRLEGSFALFCDRQKNIIGSTSSAYAVGSRLHVDDGYFLLEKGSGNSGIVELDNDYYVMGLFTSNGYREYKKHDFYQNDIIAFIFLCIIKRSDLPQVCSIVNHYQPCSYPSVQGSEETVDISTFYIGTKFFGVESHNVVGSLSHQNITRILGSDANFLGVIGTKEGGTIGVVSLNELLGMPSSYNPNVDELIVLKSSRENETKFAIVIRHIKDSPEIPLRCIKSYSGSLAGVSPLTKAVVVPDEGSVRGEMLSILDIEAIFKTLIKKREKLSGVDGVNVKR